LELEAELTDD